MTEVIAPFGGAAEMVADLKQKVFPAREIKMLVTSPDGKHAVRSV
jgi:hemolysin-activating ACP:hemolysin acyltransferase